MTLQEAIRSGKDFKRPIWKFWTYVTPKGFLTSRNQFKQSGYALKLVASDILAEDWMIREEEK